MNKILAILLFSSFVLITFFIRQIYEVQFTNLKKQLQNAKAESTQLSTELKISKVYLSASNDNKMIGDSFRLTQINFTLEETGIYSPFTATQSGVKENWTYKNLSQEEFQANLPPYNNLHILLILHKTEMPYIKSNCQNAPNEKGTKFLMTCSATPLDLSDYLYKGLTAKNFRYYQKQSNSIFGGIEYETIIQLPQKNNSINRTVKISYRGNSKDIDYRQYLRLINDIDTQSY